MLEFMCMSHYSTIEEKEEHLKAIVSTAIFIGLSIILYFGIGFLTEDAKKQSDSSFNVCSLNYKNTKELLLSESIDETFEINDYLFYGEYLDIYHNEYSIFESDPLIGRTIVLTNMCDSKEYTYMITKEVDGHIPLDSLENGFYSISVSYQNKIRRAISPNTIYEEFYTVRRNNVSKKIILVANKGLLDSDNKEDLLTENYLYLIVEDCETPIEYYDIVLDPAYSYDVGDYVEKGSTYNELNETQETYKLATIIKQKLESFGLKVLITRNSSDELAVLYGENGRLNRAYDSKAKYFVELQLNSSNNKKYSGLNITYSSFTTNKLAVKFKKQICDNTLLTPISSSTNDIDGVKESVMSNGYDGLMTIRESGGKALNAGTYSEKALTNTFAKDNRFGMQAVSISYMYITNVEEASYWQENIDLIASETTYALLSYLGIDYVITD